MRRNGSVVVNGGRRSLVCASSLAAASASALGFPMIARAAQQRSQDAAQGANNWPEKPVRMVLPFPPGGVTDLLARGMSEKLGEALGQPVIVENKPGAGTMLASDLVARAPADGYTMLMAASSLVTAPLTYPKADYDARKSFAPITQVAAVVHVLVVGTAQPYRTLADLLKDAKSNPGKLSYASTGAGTSTHLEAELLKRMAGIDMVHVPYKGSGPALTDLVGGQVPMMIDALGSSRPFIDTGKLRPLAVTTAQRSESAPDLPTMSEAGVKGYEAAPWLGLVAPAGTPDAIVQRVHEAVKDLLAQQDFRKRMREWGLDPVGSSPKEFAGYIDSEHRKWSDLIRETGIRAT